MKTVLIYGDSNTFGCNPGKSDGRKEVESFRFPIEIRWPGVLQELLGKEWRVIDEGLPGRTACLNDDIKPYRNGKMMLTGICQSHCPIDVLIFMLGTNDIKFALSADIVIKSMQELLIQVVNPFFWEHQAIPQIVLIAPPHIHDNIFNSCFAGIYPANCIEISKKLAAGYSELAKAYHCHFIDAAEYAVTSPTDGIHMEESEHRKLAVAVADRIMEMSL